MNDDKSTHEILFAEQIEEIEKNRFKDGWAYGIGGDPEWYPVIIELDKKLLEIDPDYKILQVKSKFGELRFYYETKPELQDQCEELVRKAEEETYRISKENRG